MTYAKNVALLCVGVLLHPNYRGERLFGFACHKSWTDWIARIEIMYLDIHGKCMQERLQAIPVQAKFPTQIGRRTKVKTLQISSPNLGLRLYRNSLADRVGVRETVLKEKFWTLCQLKAWL